MPLIAPISSRLTSSHPTSSYLTSSHPIPSHLIAPHLIPSHPIPSLRIPPQIFLGVFIFEIVVKWITYGIYWESKTTYFKDAWNILDFAVVVRIVLRASTHSLSTH